MTDRVELAVRELVEAIKADMAPLPEPPVLVDLATAATMLNLSRTSLYACLDSGELPSRHVGRRRLIHRADIERFAEASR